MSVQELYGQAAALHQRGQLAEAEHLYRQVIKAVPKAFPPLHMLGVLKAQQGKAEEAEGLIAAALALNPRDGSALANYGNVLTLLGRFEEALQSYDRAMAVAPDAETLRNRAHALQSLNRPGEALASYDAALQRDPKDAQSWFKRGVLLGELGRPDESLASYDRVLALQPGHVEALNNRGYGWWLFKHRYVPAIADMQKALALAPDFPYARGGVLHLPTLYSKLEELGTSIQVGEGDGLWRVHLHLLKVRRHAPIELAEELGTVVKVHMENLLDQVAPGAGGAEPLALHPVAPDEIAVVAVSPGPGLARIMASLGVSGIVSGGQSMNPSTQDILEAIGQVAAGRVIVLPNNKNIILAAQQAKELSVKEVAVVPAKTVPQGLAALLNFLPKGPKGDLAEVRAQMERATAAVESGEVTTASRSVEIDGVAVAEGQIIGLHNGRLAAAGASVPEVTLALLEKMGGADLGAISLYAGVDVTPEAAAALGEQVRGAYPQIDVVEVLPGGQPYYHYIISAE